MQGLPKPIRDPGEILGVDAGTSVDDLRHAYEDARAKAASATSLADLGGPEAAAGTTRPSVRDVEWAYREMLARALTMGSRAREADEDAAVAAVLLPGLSAEAVAVLSEQSNVVVFARREAIPASESPSAFAEEEDFTPLPFVDGARLLPDDRTNASPRSDLEDFGIPELREALERAAETVRSPRNDTPGASGARGYAAHSQSHSQTHAASSLPPLSPGDRLVPNGAITTTRIASSTAFTEHRTASDGTGAAEGRVPPRPSPATEWERDLARRRAETGSFPSSQVRPLAPLDAPPPRMATGPVMPPRTIRTVIGGEERLVVSIIAPRALESDVQEKLRAILASAEAPSGSLLRALRVESGVDEREICMRIRVPLDQLAALEEDTFDRLPAPVYYRGFVMSYLKYLGVERPDLADALTANYRAQLRTRYLRGAR